MKLGNFLLFFQLQLQCAQGVLDHPFTFSGMFFYVEMFPCNVIWNFSTMLFALMNVLWKQALMSVHPRLMVSTFQQTICNDTTFSVLLCLFRVFNLLSFFCVFNNFSAFFSTYFVVHDEAWRSG